MPEKRNSAETAASFGTEEYPKNRRLSAEISDPGTVPFLRVSEKKKAGRHGGICGSRDSETVKKPEMLMKISR